MLKPILWANYNSLSIVSGSKVSAYHISSWLIAVEGIKLQPTLHPIVSYHLFAFSSDQRGVALTEETKMAATMKVMQQFVLLIGIIFYILSELSNFNILEIYNYKQISS